MQKFISNVNKSCSILHLQFYFFFNIQCSLHVVYENLGYVQNKMVEVVVIILSAAWLKWLSLSYQLRG
jgi:hypothetical protein